MSSTFSARWVCSPTPRLRAMSAVSRISSIETEKGEHGASETRCMAWRDGSWKASTTRWQSARMSASSQHRMSGGRPPPDSPMLIEPGCRGSGAEIRGGHRIIEPGTVRVEIEMVGRGGAAAERELGKAKRRRPVDVFRPDMRPDRVQRLQPAEQRRVLRRRNGAGQVLEQVVVRVDHPRNDDMACHVDDGVGAFGKPGGGADGLDHPVTGEQAATTDLGADIVAGARRGMVRRVGRIHRAQKVGVADQQGA